MSTSRRPPVSWGDLLCYQSLPGAAQEAADAARLLGLPEVALPARRARRTETLKEESRKPSSAKPAETRFRLPLRCPQGFTVRVKRSEQSAATEPMPLPDWGPQEAAAVERMLDLHGEPPTSPTLLDMSRLQTRWRSALQSRRPGSLDLERMVQALARTEWPVPLPQRPRAHRTQDLHLCVDTHPDRQFLIDDCMACVDQLIASRPGARLSLHWIEGPWCWPTVLDSVVSGHVVLLLAEPRLMPAVEQRRWRDMETRLVAQGATVLWSLDWRPEAWPAMDGALPHPVAPLRTDGDATHELSVVDAADLPQLLACLAPAMTVEPALIRAMIQALRLPGGLVLERAVWCHPDLDGALPFRQWHGSPQREHLQRLRQQPPEVIDACWAVLSEFHPHRSQVQRDQELLDWADAAGEEGVARRGIVADFDQAKLRYGRVVQHLLQLRDHADAVGLANVSSPGVIRAAAMQRLQSLPNSLGADRSYLEGLLLKAVERSDVGTWLSALDSADANTPLSVSLFQQGQRLLLMPADFTGPGAQMATLKIDARPLIVECDGASRVIPYPRGALSRGGVVLAEWARVPPRSVRVRGGLDELYVDTVPRPHWAAEFAQQSTWARYWVTYRTQGLGMDGLIHWPDGNPVVLEPLTPEGEIVGGKDGWKFEIDQYGPRLSFDFSATVLRLGPRVYFRYIPPGTFLQGSPQGIDEEDEYPQHPVTLTKGFWLAETPCTQALWQAVMGENPSHFKHEEDAPRRPVENVSWNHVADFLKELVRLLPAGFEAVLPTESQWEYACRAGTLTAYWWGDEPEDSRANWDKQHGSTTDVQRYPPNPWGLYDMHGNVWECCRDAKRKYDAEPARDPERSDARGFHVVRGGSWSRPPSFARAPYRGGGYRGIASQIQGFRFALWSLSGPDARPGGPGARRMEATEAARLVSHNLFERVTGLHWRDYPDFLDDKEEIA